MEKTALREDVKKTTLYFKKKTAVVQRQVKISRYLGIYENPGNKNIHCIRQNNKIIVRGDLKTDIVKARIRSGCFLERSIKTVAVCGEK